MPPTQKSIFVIAALVLAALFAFFSDAIWLLRGPVGVDVSHHQKDIDWPRLARSGVAFAYIKATEGGDYVDRKFAENWRAAAAAGVTRGAYHFFRQCRPGAVQARNFIATVPKDASALPPVVDVEDAADCPPGSGVAAPHIEVGKFLDLVEAHFGCRPIVYTTPEYEDAYLREKLPDERFWLRSLFMPPQYRAQRWMLWQYHNAGHRNGVEGPVDLNVFRGSRADFARFAAGAGCAP